MPRIVFFEEWSVAVDQQAGYDKYYKQHLDDQFDDRLDSLEGLRWLPWVGKGYANSGARVLVVGESHYGRNRKCANKTADQDIQEVMDDREFTREVIVECPILDQWPNPTYSNIARALLGSGKIDEHRRTQLWERVAFFNLVQRALNYTDGERPTQGDFAEAWAVFASLACVLKPRVCVVFGVGASDYFNGTMERLQLGHSRAVRRADRIDRVCLREGAALNAGGGTIPLCFVRHPAKYFRWGKWHKYLCEQMPEAMKQLGSTPTAA
jgi:hypothetical protein